MAELGWVSRASGVSLDDVFAICDLGDPAQMFVAMAAMVLRLIPGDEIWRTRLDSRAGSALTRIVRDIGWRANAEFGRLLVALGPGSPRNASYVSGPLDLRPRRLPEACPVGDRKSGAGHQADLVPRSTPYQLSLVTSLRNGAGHGWVLVREQRDFAASELELAATVLPTLTALDRLARERCSASAPASTCTAELSLREREVLSMVANGLTAVAIGRRLGIAPATVRKHLEKIYRKLGEHDRLVAVTRARELGILTN